MNKEIPNIFKWATSELSQDAFICWLLSWADYENVILNDVAKYLINRLTDDKIVEIKDVRIKRQENNIDIQCVVNNEFVILIEDKTHTKDHSNQLKKYFDFLCTKYEKDKIFPVYFKTGDQGDYNSIIKAGYKPFLRKDFIEVLQYAIDKGANNDILIDFYQHMLKIENSVQSYKYLPVSEWHWDSWKGFYSELSERLQDGIWDYVPQKNGGFLGFWWYWIYKDVDDVEFEYYLQLEHNKFCFKVSPYKREDAEFVRNHYREILFSKAKEHNISIYQNGRIGNTMTVAALNESYIKTDEKGLLDMDKTIELIRKIEIMFKDIYN